MLKAGASRGGSAEVESLFAEYRRTRDPEVRNQLVVLHLHLVRRLAAKFAHRGEPLEDLVQVGSIGLIHAVERFDPERGTKFSTYATPTIVGEIQRYFRDSGWTLKAPRGLQELNLRLIRANEDLSQQYGRSPTIVEMAEHLGVPEETILDAMELGQSYQVLSLDRPVEGDGTDTVITLQDSLGVVDSRLQQVEIKDAIQTAVERLDRKGRTIIHLRYFQGLSQTEVAMRLQISQMHVSRLQRKALNQLKELLAEGVDEQWGLGGYECNKENGGRSGYLPGVTPSRGRF